MLIVENTEKERHKINEHRKKIFELRISEKCSLQQLFVYASALTEEKKKKFNRITYQQVKGKMQNGVRCELSSNVYFLQTLSNRLKRMAGKYKREANCSAIHTYTFTNTHKQRYVFHIECERERVQNECENHWNVFLFSSILSFGIFRSI